MAKMKINVIGANQTLVHLPVGTILFSYETPVAAYVSGRGYIRTAEKFSKTTSKHINQWLRRMTGSGSYAATGVDQTVFDNLVGGI